MTIENLITTEEFEEIIAHPDYTNKHIELIEGVIYEMSPASAIPTVVAMIIGRLMGNFVAENDLGWITGADGGFVVAPHTLLVPDVGFISKLRQPELPERFFQTFPDLAVEVVSPTDSVKDIQRKAMRYLSYGTPLVWVAYPVEKVVDVCQLPQSGQGMNIQTFSLSDTLDGGTVLPGFKLSVRSIFPH